jgi:acyl carrier protein
MTLMSTRPEIIRQSTLSSEEHEQTLAPLSNHRRLLDYGLDSLGFTFDVAHLEDQLQIDLFTSDEHLDVSVTLGDFIAAYERLDK